MAEMLAALGRMGLFLLRVDRGLILARLREVAGTRAKVA